jgi:hypothetical protein
MDTLVRALQRQIVPRVDFAVTFQTNVAAMLPETIRAQKRLEPEEQIEPVRLQYV